MIVQFFFTVLIVVSLLTFSSKAHAYLDPGAGSMVLQGLLAAFFAVVAFLGVSWRKLKSWWQHFITRHKG
ncbi:MAG: hypothetical protein A4E65_01969 [Syntrophorhabdus sp. PtaU1.Bin153]|nr:MAG: hypothetical protein A4E65_01969 [Syntrophorhabdus sp. PtaU1.Bin153]